MYLIAEIVFSYQFCIAWIKVNTLGMYLTSWSVSIKVFGNLSTFQDIKSTEIGTLGVKILETVFTLHIATECFARRVDACWW